MATFTHQPGDRYLITGKRADGKRFRKEMGNPHYALAHNVYRGTLWQVRDGKRTRVHTWHN